MNSPAELRGRQLVRLKQAQRQLSLLSAQSQQQAAAARREEAAGLRASASETLDRAVLQPETGLSRSLLFDRLRILAVARAHALETGHAAGDLEADAAQCEAAEVQQRQRAALQFRKQKKLEHWHHRQHREASRRRELRLYTLQLDELTCRRRSPR
ncbi:hypothetical protein ABE522_09055 [Stenotrophomonas pennii]|uniref:hypothetical protein n=1 Tax=Stenotrophomonas lacuserhaii TaxID=2760084 RepID=UPI00320832F4